MIFFFQRLRSLGSSDRGIQASTHFSKMFGSVFEILDFDCGAIVINLSAFGSCFQTEVDYLNNVARKTEGSNSFHRGVPDSLACQDQTLIDGCLAGLLISRNAFSHGFRAVRM